MSSHSSATAGVRSDQGRAPAATPAMRQYMQQKREVGDAILLFRMGDFYETFFEDAVLCSKVLGIALTSRSKGEDAIPLAGIPFHALDGYLRKLVSAGYKVAISEQLEDASQAKGVVRRGVVRIVTAGTLTDEALLGERDASVLAAIRYGKDGTAGLAALELASGRFEAANLTPDDLLSELVRLGPSELLIDDERDGPEACTARRVEQMQPLVVTRRPVHEFSAYQAERSLLEQFGVASLAGFGFDGMSPGLCAAGCIVQYLRETQRTSLDHIRSIRARRTNDLLKIDPASFRALEIDRGLRSGTAEGTLLRAVDLTIHPSGGRLLREWLGAPLTTPDPIRARHDAVGLLVEQETQRARIRRLLQGMSDVERIVARIALRRVSPRDLAGLGKTLNRVPELAALIPEHAPKLLLEIRGEITGFEELAKFLAGAIRDDPPPHAREGGFIAPGFDQELDRLHAVHRDGKSWLAEYQRRQIERTGLASLKVGFNRVFGYYIEAPRSAKDQIPPDYVRRQTVKNAERYVTEELKTYESEALTAQQRALEREMFLFEQVRAQVATRTNDLLQMAGAVGRLDCLAALAELAVKRRYVRPEIVEENRLHIRDGRHPVLDQTLGDAFVPNDTALEESRARVLVITGPNMAGKSTYIRQTALLTLLAQAGSFVPASQMTWSPVDRIFARVGSSDEIMRGQSTFMVEMTEAANILHNATPRSLVILDELGRGTSTFDGLSLAWAITEHLATRVKCKALVATHYHELTELEHLLPGVRNYNVAVREYAANPGGDEGIVFLHRIVEGGASKSYGIHVARLAGIPDEVIRRSREVLEELQRGFQRETRTPCLAPHKPSGQEQLALFCDPAEELLDALRRIDPNELPPIEALRILSEWKARLHA